MVQEKTATQFMSLEEFRSTRQAMTAARFKELYGENGMLASDTETRDLLCYHAGLYISIELDGKYGLVIENEDWLTTDLPTLEIRLYVWACGHIINEKVTGLNLMKFQDHAFELTIEQYKAAGEFAGTIEDAKAVFIYPGNLWISKQHGVYTLHTDNDTFESDNLTRQEEILYRWANGNVFNVDAKDTNELREALSMFAKAACRLSAVWTEYDGDVLNDGYPFDKDFQEVALNINGWSADNAPD